MKELIELFEDGQKRLEEEFHTRFVVAIKKELAQLNDDEVVKLSSTACEFESIPTGEYTDAINEINKEGFAPCVYNHLACDCDSFAHNEPVSVFDYPVEVLKHVLTSLVEHNANRPKLVQQILPPDQVDILSRAINILETALGDQLQKEEKDTGRLNDDINNTLFDIIGLRGMLKSGEISVILPKDIVEYFVHHHNVDFPEYVGDKYQRKEL